MRLLQTLPAANPFYAALRPQVRYTGLKACAPHRSPDLCSGRVHYSRHSCHHRTSRRSRPRRKITKKKFSPFASQFVKTDFNCELPLGCARNARSHKAANSTQNYMTKLRPSLAISIRIVFASLFLCLFGALPAFATDGIYNQFSLDLG